MKTPADKNITFTFMSELSARRDLHWTARVDFPPEAQADTLLPVSATDAQGKPIESAKLELCGQILDIRSGQASMKYSDFIKGKHELPIWMYRKGFPPVAGRLTFA